MIEFHDELDDEEFDIQLSVLKRRTLKNEQAVYVEYDRLTYALVLVSPVIVEPSARRNLVTSITPSTLTDRLFSNKLPLSKLKIKKNIETDSMELLLNTRRHKGEFDFVFATTQDQSYINLHCDVVAKKIHVNFSYIIFKTDMSSEKIVEKDLEDLPDYIEIYCMDKNERSRLYGTFTINTKELFQEHTISYKCPWLPDDNDQLNRVGFVYYNDNQIISVGHEIISDPQIIEQKFKPNLLYKQEGNVLKLQSTMQDIRSFRLNDKIILYFYQKYDPTMMLGSITLNSSELNNYNQFNITLSNEKEVNLVSNYFHLHAEEDNANTYY